MINQAQIINQPYSGEYDEKIYYLRSKCNSRDWTWVKFTNEDYTEWCGQFQGAPINVAMSKKHNTIVVLTSDYLYMVSREDGRLLEHESHCLYRNLTLTPKGDYLISDYSSIELFKTSLLDKKVIEGIYEMDMIEFHDWNENKLLIKCEHLYINREYELLFDCETSNIIINKIVYLNESS